MPRIIVNIDVDDLARGIAFYRDALGLRLVRHLFEGRIAELTDGTTLVHLLTKPAGSPAISGGPPARDYARHWTPVHADFVVEDLDAAVERARAAGVTQEGSIREGAWGRIASFSDPFGHGICLIELSARGYDAVEG